MIKRDCCHVGVRKLSQADAAAALATKAVEFGKQEATGGVADAKQAAVSASNMDISSEKPQALADGTKDLAQTNAFLSDLEAFSGVGRRQLLNFQGEVSQQLSMQVFCVCHQ